MDLTNKKISYLVLSSEKLDDVMSFLWAKDFKIIQMKSYYKGDYEDSIIAFQEGIENDDLRRETLFILNHFNKENAIIKYLDESNANNLFYDGSEKPLSVSLYNTNPENRSFLHNGISFSFNEENRYWQPKCESDLKVGMVVEYLNKNRWNEYTIQNPSTDYNKMFKLLIKYDKVRVVSN